MDFEGEDKGFECTLYDLVTGKSLGVCPIEATAEMKENINPPLFTRSYALELEKPVFNYGMIGELTDLYDKEFRVVMESDQLNKLKYIAKRTKNKRIKNKVKNKIVRIDHPIFNEGVLIKGSNIKFN
ncbi:hypothetical protein ACWA2B_10435 [Paenibacillus sp. CMM36]